MKKVRSFLNKKPVKICTYALIFSLGAAAGCAILNKHYDNILKNFDVMAFDCFEGPIGVKDLFEIFTDDINVRKEMSWSGAKTHISIDA